MPNLKVYNSATSQWEYLLVGKQGDPGPAGPEGPSGVVNVTSPITNSGTTTSAVLGLDVSALPVTTNAIINGAFDIWQRGTTYTMNNNPGYGAADRWIYWHNGSSFGTNVISRQAFTPGAAPVAGYEAEFFHRWTVTALGTGQTVADMWNRIEDVRSFAGQTVTLSFWAKASSTFTLALSLEQIFGSGGSSTVPISLNDVTLGTSWQRFTRTVTLPSISGKTIGSNSNLQLVFRLLSPTAGSTFDIWGVQLEAGSVATPFKRNAPSIQAELAACQRYYYRAGGVVYAKHGIGAAYNTVGCQVAVPLPVPMRAIPTAIDFSALALNRDALSSYIPVTNVSIVGASQTTTTGMVSCDVASGLTAGTRYDLVNNNNTAGYLGFSAEL